MSENGYRLTVGLCCVALTVSFIAQQWAWYFDRRKVDELVPAPAPARGKK